MLFTAPKTRLPNLFGTARISRARYATISPNSTPLQRKNKGEPPLTLEHFVQRSRALALWRDVVRVVRRIPSTSPTRNEMRSFAREEFERYRDVRDLSHIRYLISTGKTQLDSMSRYVEQSVR